MCLHIKCMHIIAVYAGNRFEDPLFFFFSVRANMKKSRTIGWVLLIAVVAGAGYFGWQRIPRPRAQRRPKLRRRRPRPPAVPGQHRPGRKGRLSGLPDRARHGSGLQHRSRTDPGRRPDRQDRLQGRPEVKQGDLLAEIDPRPFQAALDQAKAKKAQDEANLANANLDLQRYTKLGEFATRQQTDTQRSTVAQLTAQIAADDAAISNAQTQLDYTQVKSPISGVVGLRQVDVGNIVNASTQTGIVTVTQIEPITVIFTAPEEQLPYISEAQTAGAARRRSRSPPTARSRSRKASSRSSTTRSTRPAGLFG